MTTYFTQVLKQKYYLITSTDFFVPWALSGFDATLLPVLLNGYGAPTPIQGFINEDHVRQKSFAWKLMKRIDLTFNTIYKKMSFMNLEL